MIEPHELPHDLSPMVTTHPASSAYKVENPHVGVSWTYAEQRAIARALVARDRDWQAVRLNRAVAERHANAPALAALVKNLRGSATMADAWRHDGGLSVVDVRIEDLHALLDHVDALRAALLAICDPTKVLKP